MTTTTTTTLNGTRVPSESAPWSTLFTDIEKNALRFFVQGTLPEELKGSLATDIRNNGGTVIDKIPVKGYIIAEPDTQDGQRLLQQWRDIQKPKRYFVPCAFVSSCVRANKVHQQIFLEDGKPIKFHIHESIAIKLQRQKCKERILCVGGDPYASEGDARVIIADAKVCESLAKEYEASITQFVEPPIWIKQCIDADKYEHSSLVRKNIGGCPIGGRRNLFTEKEDTLLAHYIARVIPEKNMSGKTGNNIYIRLVELGANGTPGYEWATRHSWHSWRNRYKHHKDRLDKISEDYRREHNIIPGYKGQYAFVHKKQNSDKAALSETESETQNEKQVTKKRKRPTPDISNTPPRHVMQNAPETILTRTDSSTLDASQSESQWVIREGKDEPPPWARNSVSKAPGTPTQSNSGPATTPKRPRIDDSDLNPEVYDEEMNERIFQTMSERYRWHIDEIRETYQKCGDMEETRETIANYRKAVDIFKQKPA